MNRTENPEILVHIYQTFIPLYASKHIFKKMKDLSCLLLNGPLIFCWQALQPFCIFVGCSHTTCNSSTSDAQSSFTTVTFHEGLSTGLEQGNMGQHQLPFMNGTFLPSTSLTVKLFISLGVTFNVYTLSETLHKVGDKNSH